MMANLTNGDVATLAQNPDTNGCNGLHNQPARLLLKGKRIYISETAFFVSHDPTTPNRQDPMWAAIIARLPVIPPPEREAIMAPIQQTNASKHRPNPVVTCRVFYSTEKHHYNYCKLHPNQRVITQS